MSTKIAWVTNPANELGSGETLNPVRGCKKVDAACENCYAERLASTRLKHRPAYAGLTKNGRWTGKVRLFPELIDRPLHWRKPRGVFWCDMGDLFHPDVPFEFIDRVMAIVAMTPQHRHFVLTKRAGRLAEYMLSRGFEGRMVDTPILRAAAQYDERFAAANQDMEWPFPNLWLGITAGTQQALDERWPHLAKCPAAVRFISWEPGLSPLIVLKNASWIIAGVEQLAGRKVGRLTVGPTVAVFAPYAVRLKAWLGWARDIVDQCEAANIACFVKQIPGPDGKVIHDPARFPPGLRVRQWPHNEA